MCLLSGVTTDAAKILEQKIIIIIFFLPPIML